MQDSTSSPKYSTEANSELLSLSESCVRSDIAEIISKMYTPRMEKSRNLNIDTSFQGLETRKSAVSREVLFNMDNDQEKHIGFFSEMITKKGFRTVISNTSEKDSSMSDSVSIPIVEHVNKSSRKRCVYYCECCRRSMVNRNSQYRAKKACRHCCYCNKNNCLDLKTLPQPVELSQLEHTDSSLYKAQGDFIPKQKQSKANFDPSKALSQCSKCLPTVVPSRKSRSEQLGRRNSQNKLQKRVIIPSHGELNVNPSLVMIGEQSMQKRNPNEAERTQSKTLLRRFITNIASWHITFQRDKMSNSMCALTGNVDISGNVTKNPFILCSCQDQNKQAINPHTSLKSAHLSEGIPLVTRKSETTNSQRVSKHCEREERRENGLNRIEPKLPPTDDTKIMINNAQRFGHKDDEASRQNSDDEVHLNYENTCNDQIKTDDQVIDCGIPSNVNPKLDGFDSFRLAYKNNFKRTEDLRPLIFDRTVAERSTDWATNFWAGVFGSCHKVINFFTAFLLELLRFLLHGLIHPLLWRTVEIASDYFFRPCLSALFFNVIQPVFTLLQNIATSLRDLCLPISQCFGHFLREIAYVFSVCRMVEVNKTTNNYEASRNP